MGGGGEEWEDGECAGELCEGGLSVGMSVDLNDLMMLQVCLSWRVFLYIIMFRLCHFLSIYYKVSEECPVLAQSMIASYGLYVRIRSVYE